jgi:NADH:ubiquinone oxidoreductase subunit F (NADH-binding)
VAAGVAAAIAERPPGERPVLVRVPHSFVAGEESALLNALDGGPAAPTGRRPYEAGVLVQNVETLAHLALVARYGSDWFRDVGTDAEPGTALATVRGSVATPGVLEFEHGETLGRLLDRCGGATEPLQAVLVGGYFGTWVPYDPRLVLSNAGLRRHGATLGARVVLALPASANGLIETTRIVRYLAGESAGQCGPCVFGLPALADALEAGDDERAVRLARTVKGRGACAHPDGAAQLVESAYRTFAS